MSVAPALPENASLKFLDIVDAVDHWVVPDLSQSGLQQMQDHLGVFGIVLVPGVVRRFAGTGERQCGNQPQPKTLLVAKIRQRPMIVLVASKPIRTEL
jgi:hypothetical protein